jgi:hypothetical protein
MALQHKGDEKGSGLVVLYDEYTPGFRFPCSHGPHDEEGA